MSTEENGLRISNAIKKLSKTSGQDINEIRIIIALERLVARLQASKSLQEVLVFKGGFILLKVASSKRFTRDLDALVIGASEQQLKQLVTQALTNDLNDGVWFGEVETSSLPDHGEYAGIRFTAAYQIGEIPDKKKLHKLSRIHFDTAFGDVLPLGTEEKSLDSAISNFTALSWRVYPLESIVAEKLQTLVNRGSLNSRAKDCYDLVFLLEKLKIESRLIQTLKATFVHRETPLPKSFHLFFKDLDFTTLRHAWRSVALVGDAMSFDVCISRLTAKLSEIDEALSKV